MQLRKPLDEKGNVIDASFSVEETELGYSLYFASRGGSVGSAESRNSQYHIGLTILLERLRTLEVQLTDLMLDSTAARKLPVDARRLHLPSDLHPPISLSQHPDLNVLRKTIQEAQRNVLVAPNRNPKHGNRVRSIRLQFSMPNHVMTLGGITDYLSAGEYSFATAHREELDGRATVLRNARSIPRPTGNIKPLRVAISARAEYQRLPAVVAYVIERARGHCELCNVAGFATDSGYAYLEVHHVLRLTLGGPDTADNATALCANCHRELHFGVRRGALLEILYKKVPELNRYIADHTPWTPGNL